MPMTPFYNRWDAPNRWLKRQTAVCAFAAIVSIGWSIAQFAAAAIEAERSAAEMVAEADIAPVDLSQVARMGWFGFSKEAPVEMGSVSAASLELKGISASSEASLMGAFIGVRGGDEAYYRPGDSLPGNAGTLAEIFADHVTIRQGEDTIILSFAELPASAPDAAQPVTLQRPGGEAPLELGAASEIVAQFQTDPQGMLQQSGLTPVVQGEDRGYRFNGNDTQRIFTSTGLQKDDVILAVNDMAVGDTDNDRFRVVELAGMKLLKLKVQRGDNIIGLDYRLP